MNMLKQEWKNFLSNRVLVVSTIIMMFIPIIYAGVFLSASWDPFGNTDRLPVAVVNEDMEVDFEGEVLSIGKDLVKNLKENDELEWHFVAAEVAEKGMDDGDYHMVITIPKEFSANAVTVLDENPEQMEIKYETNPGRGFFNDSLSKQSTASINKEIAENVTTAYVETVFSKIGDIGEGFSDAASGAKQVDDGVGKLQEGNSELTINLEKLASSTLTFKDGADQLQVGLASFVEGATQLQKGANELNKGINDYTAGVNQLNIGAKELAEGTDQLKSNGPALVNGTVQLSGGLDQLLVGSSNLNNGLSAVQSGSVSLNNGLHQLQNKANGLIDQTSETTQLLTGQNELNTALVSLRTGSEELHGGLKQLNGQLPSEENILSLSQGLEAIQKQVSTLNGTVPNGSNMSATISTITENVAASESLLASIRTQNESVTAETVEALQQTTAYTSLDEASKAELVSAVTEQMNTQKTKQDDNIKSLAESVSMISTQVTEEVLPLANGLGSFPEQVNKLNETVNAVHPGAIKSLKGYTEINKSLTSQFIPGAAQLQGGLEESLRGSEKLVTGVEQSTAQIPILVKAINQLADGGDSLNEGIAEVVTGSSGLQDGVSGLYGGATTLQSSILNYTDAISQVNDGTQEFITGTNELSSNSSALKNGASSLNTGIGQLAENVPLLSNGVDQITNGAAQINEGSTALAEGSNELGKGMLDLKDGTDELSSKLADGSNDIDEIHTTDENYQMMAAPTHLKEEKLSEVPNYGHALAPYIISLGLYIGALAFNLIFPLTQPSMRPTSAIAWWFSKFSLGFIQAIMAALIVDAIMIFGMGLQVDHIGQFIIISILTSLAYMFLIMFLGLAFGNPGRFLAMILLIVQLAASGGMFPIELSGPFFNMIHSFIPMTHAIIGFREAMSSAYGSGAFVSSIIILVSFVILFNLLLLVALRISYRKEAKLVTE